MNPREMNPREMNKREMNKREMNKREMNKREMNKDAFEYHRPTDAQTRQIAEVRSGCKALAAVLSALPPGREKSLAFTKLEEVSMWANKSVVMADPEPAEVGYYQADERRNGGGVLPGREGA